MQVSYLGKLPPDHLALITSRLYGGSIIALWTCGNRQLQSKLSSGGVVDIMLENYEIHPTSRYPKFLSQLHHLRSLHISRSLQRLGEPDEIGRELQKLTGRLEYLELQFQEAESCLLRPLLDQEGLLVSLFDESGIVDSESCGIEPRVGPSRLWNLAETFPRLRVLKLKTQRPSFVPEDYQDLPPTLEHLVASWTFPDWRLKLTKNLKEFSFHNAFCRTPAIELEENELPEQLEVLSYVTIGESSVKKLSKLPLTSLDHCGPLLVHQPLSTLFPHLTRLSIMGGELGFDLKLLEGLPMGLTFLSLESSTSGHTDTRLIMSLPRSLTTIKFHSSLVMDLTTVETLHWPPQLTQFKGTTHFEPSFYSTLPQSIQNLDIEIPRQHTGHVGTAASGQEAAKASFESLSQCHLPSLKTLRVSVQSNISFNWTDEMRLPRTLTSLTLAYINIDAAFYHNLPPTLRELTCRFSYIEIFTALEGLEHLPRGLEKLCLFGTLRTFHYTLQHIFSSLPSNLKHLTLEGLTQQITAEEAMCLPRTLSHFESYSLSVPTSQAVANLPRSLTTLKLLGDFDETAAAALPPLLEILSVQRWASLKDDQIAFFPRKLRVLTIYGAITSARSYMDLPRSLIYVILSQTGAAFTSKFLTPSQFPITTPDPRVLLRYSSISEEQISTS